MNFDCLLTEVSLDPNIDKIEENDKDMVMHKPTSAPASPCLKQRTTTLSGAATCRPIFF